MSVDASARPEAAVLDFGGSMTAAAVDRVLMAEYVSRTSYSALEEFELDFSATHFSEPAALQSIVSICRTLLAQRKQVSFKLPRQQKERDFWRAWNFPQALEAATGRTFRELSAREDHVYFGEEQKFFRRSEINLDRTKGHQELAFLNHFPIYSKQVERGQRAADVAYQFKNTWNAKHVQDVLHRKIGKNYGYFASRVVFEAIMNALRHPGASLIQTGAIDQAASKKSKALSYLNAHFWDNGASIADTLYKAIQRGVRVREGKEDEFKTNYLLRYEPDLNSPSQDVLVPFDVELNQSTPQHIALLATLFPLVTSAPVGEHFVDEELRSTHPRLAQRGMGLFVLINTVVEVMSGEVSFRTSNFFMNVRKPDGDEATKFPSANLTVRIRRFPSTSTLFTGNLLVARIPIVPQHA
ncbi:MAG: hypothetical protein ABIL01_30115 [Pseudomonadota bacterium]